MTDTKKQRKKSTGTKAQKTESETIQTLDCSGHSKEENSGNEPWRKWKVKPDLKHMPATPPEAGIAKRIAYCRGQLDNLSVEALARYSKNFDKDGVSRMSIIRYESGDNTPGARELRILCDALWVPPNWLLFGKVDSDATRHAGNDLLDALAAYIYSTAGSSELRDISKMLTQGKEKQEIADRQRWIDEARKPQPR